MILVDSSVLIDFFRQNENESVAKFHSILNQEIPYCISEVTYAEVLQGANSESAWNALKGYLDSISVISNTRGLSFYADAARIFYDCRKKGISPKGLFDCWIVQTAIDRDLYLLHNDKDYANIKKVVRNLKFF